MIDLAQQIDERLIFESKKKDRLFNDDSMTFKQLKDIFNDVFSTSIVSVSRKVPMTSFYITNKDGNYFVSAVGKPQKMLKIDAFPKVMNLSECSCKPMKCTLDSIVDALSSVDSVLLNRFFANGKNRVKLSAICPPDGCESSYGDRCFLVVDGIDCFDDNGKVAGWDKKSTTELCKILKANDGLKHEFCVLSPKQIAPLKRCKSEKKILDDIMNCMQKLVDGIGWNSTIRDYVQDRYSREIVNKALKHGIDASKNGAFVDELVSRLSGTSSMRPTKSDLMTFAKRENINCKSQEYKDFIDDIESTADQTSRQILSPIQKLIWYALSKAVSNMIGYIELDNGKNAKKLLKLIPSGCFDSANDINGCELDPQNIDAVKKALDKVLKYKDFAPSEIRVMLAGKPYSLKGDIEKLQRLQEVIG